MSRQLDVILPAVREELAARKSAVPFPILVERAGGRGAVRDIRRKLGAGPGIIAEIKRASPSKGWIRRDLDASWTAKQYVEGGACAISVLTEGRFFGGSLADLADVAGCCGDVPVLRKDFILDEYMLAESRAFGADIVLLIVAVLGEDAARMVRAAAAFGLEALVEVHDEEEMEIAARAGAGLIGINNRDLSTLKVDLETSARLLPIAPAGAVKIVESGISAPEEVRKFHALGADAFLVGEALITANDPREAVRALRGGTSPCSG